jgi:hypothetical protein
LIFSRPVSKRSIRRNGFERPVLVPVQEDLRMRLHALFVSLLLLSSSALVAGDLGILGEIQPLDPIKPSPAAVRSLTVMYYCYCFVHGLEPCKKHVWLIGLADEDCPATPGLPCGHTKALHPDILSGDWVRQAGFLTDFRSPDVPTKEIVIGNGPQDPVEFPIQYTAGQASGSLVFRTVSTEPPRNHYFLTPQSVPPFDCESPAVCTLDFRIHVRVPRLREFQKPILVSAVNGQPIPWLRCGLTPCTEGVDDPYNWPEHRRTHWGTPKTVDDLVAVAWRWYNLCSESYFDPVAGIQVVTSPQDLVVSDMSLPYGGLFDIGHDWRPLDKPPGGSGIGHWLHRRGSDVDLSQRSVPLSGVCGPRPTGGTWDPTWMETSIWTDDSLLEEIGLTHPYPKDPGHLKEVK